MGIGQAEGGLRRGKIEARSTHESQVEGAPVFEGHSGGGHETDRPASWSTDGALGDEVDAHLLER